MPDKKMVLHIIQSLDSGGCENMLLRTLPLVSGYEHHILTLHHEGDLAPQFRERSIAVSCADMRGLLNMSGWLHFRKAVRALSPDLVITYLFHADMAGRFLLRGVFPSSPIPFLRTTYNYPRYLPARILERLSSPLVPAYLANSEAVKEYYAKRLGVPEEKIEIIPNGIDTAMFDALQPDEKLRKELGIPADSLTLICVANLHPNKGHRFLLEAFENAWHQDPRLRLLIVGDGEERSRLEEQTRQYASRGNIFFLGRRSDVPALLRLSRIFVFPTLFEGMSNAIMEAMAAGLAIIATDIPENRQLLGQDEALLVAPEDASALSEAIERFTRDEGLRSRLGTAARNRMRMDYSLSAVSERWKLFIAKHLHSAL